MNFIKWLEAELRVRNWSQSDLARKARIRPNTVSRVLSGERRPGPDFCRAVAGALGYPAEVVFRRAGLLPPRPEVDEEIEQAVYLLAQMTPAARREALAYIRFKARMDEDGEPPGEGGVRRVRESRESPALGG